MTAHEAIKVAMLVADISKAELARRLGISGPAVSAMLSEDNAITTASVEKIMRACGCELYFEVRRIRKPDDLPPEEPNE